MAFTAFKQLVTSQYYMPEDMREALAKGIERQTGIDDVNMLTVVKQTWQIHAVCWYAAESSVAAFKTPLLFMINSSRNVLDWIEHAGKMPVWKGGMPGWMILRKHR